MYLNNGHNWRCEKIMVSARLLLRWRSRFLILLAISIAALFAMLFNVSQPSTVDAATTLPTKMNFQGRITNSLGLILANGTYNMRFKIYNASSGGTLQWSEDRLVAATQGVSITNGQFNVQLGSISSLPASIFTSNSLYFEVELPTPASATTSSPVWTEGPMTPRNQLATSAYAYNAETLDGIDSDSFAQLGAANAFTAANSVTVAHANAFQVKNGSTNLFNVDTSGSTISVGASDTTGALLVLDTKTGSGDPTGANGGMYYNSNASKFRCFEASTWKDCIVTPPVVSLQTAYDNDASGTADIVTSSGTKTFLFKAGATFDSTALFDIQNAASTSLFSVDSTNSRIYIGSSTADATGTVLVLDTKNNAGDPTGVNGAMYYNSSTGYFRCYQASTWKNCISDRLDLRTAADVTNSTTTGADVTGLTWSVAANTDYSFDCVIVASSAAAGTGIQMAVNGPATPTQVSAYIGISNIASSTGAAATANMPFTMANAYETYQANTAAVTTRVVGKVSGVIRNGANAGTAAIRLRSEVAASAVTVHRGSSCTIY